MSESRNKYANWNKPDTKRWIFYSLEIQRNEELRLKGKEKSEITL